MPILCWPQYDLHGIQLQKTVFWGINLFPAHLYDKQRMIPIDIMQPSMGYSEILLSRKCCVVI